MTSSGKSGFETHSGHFTGSRGRRIFTRVWRPDTQPRGVVILVHGLGEHSGRYEDLAACFAQRGWAVAALDHNGHGKSGGEPGFMRDIDDFVDDVHTLRQRTQAEFPSTPLFLLGHSLGGLIASLYLVKRQEGLSGAVLSGALIRTPDHPGRIQRGLISLLAGIYPRLGLVKLDAAGISHDEQVVRAYEEDPLVFHGRMAVGQLREMFAATDRIAREADAITLPMLILHGELDPMTDAEGSRLLHDLISSADKSLTIYPGLYHEIFNEPAKASIYDDVLHWCEQRLPGR